ncbi:MAG: flagellar hook-associated protein FlgK [Candidatus Sericytochromatia bacterium]
MRPAFLGLNIARSALFTSQQQLDITSHNIANASVQGYTRQRLAVEAAPDIYGLGPQYPGAVGGGVWGQQLERLRDGLLDRDWRRRESELQAATTQRSYLERLEQNFGELGENGLQSRLESFFDAWQDLSQRPEDTALRKVVLATAQDLAERVRETDTEARELQQSAQDELRQVVARVNEITGALAELNGEILTRSGAGDTPADLLDQRDRLLDELAGYAAIQIEEDEYGKVQVRIDGKAVVTDDQSHEIRVLPENDVLRSNRPVGVPNTLNRGDLIINGVDIIGTGAPLTLASAADYGQLLDRINGLSNQTGISAQLDAAGKLELSGSADGTSYLSLQQTGVGLNVTGLEGGNYALTDRVRLQLRTGTYLNSLGGRLGALDETRNQVIPAQLEALQGIVAELSQRVNSLHSNAYDLSGQTGRPFFVGGNPADLAVADSLLADPSKLAIAGSPTFPPGDGSQALGIYNLRNDLQIDARYRELTTGLGTAVARSGNDEIRLGLVRDQIENQRQSVSGVSLDEELANMLQYQRSFNAAARVMNALDEMLSQVVNGLGLVGR